MKLSCDVCDYRGTDNGLLEAFNPFDRSDIIRGCPQCKSIDCFTELCDEEDCEQPVTCGWKSPSGYRRTCYRHSKFAEET